MRALYYAQGRRGLGHLRRAAALARGLLESFPSLSILGLLGAPFSHVFGTGDRLDFIKLPCLKKDDADRYSARYLSVPGDEIRQLRSQIVAEALRGFNPDILLVDNIPSGAGGELAHWIRALRTTGARTRVILVLRDVLDDPERVIRAWTDSGEYELLEECYDLIFVCGDPLVFDPVTAYRFSTTLRGRTVFGGYVPRNLPAAGPRTGAGQGMKHVMVTVGGGCDGDHVVRAYLDGLSGAPDYAGHRSILLLGPEMDSARAEEFLSSPLRGVDLEVIRYSDDPLALMARCELVVAMAGFNTVSEILQMRKRAILVPRTHPTQEQVIRAESLSRLGLAEILHPTECTPHRLATMVQRSLTSQASLPRLPFGFTAIRDLAEAIRRLL